MDPKIEAIIAQLIQLMGQNSAGYGGGGYYGGNQSGYWPMTPSQAGAGMPGINTGPFAADSLGGMAYNVFAPAVASMITGQQMVFQPQRAPGMNYFDAAVASNMTQPLFQSASNTMASNVGRGVGNDLGRMAKRYLGADQELADQLAALGGTSPGLTQFIYRTGIMDSISGGNPMQGFSDMYQRRDLMFSTAGTPRSYLKTINGKTEFDFGSELNLHRQAVFMGQEMYTQVYGEHGSQASRVKVMTDILKKEGKSDMAAELATAYTSGGMEDVQGLLITDRFMKNDLAQRLRNEAYKTHSYANLEATQGFKVEDVTGLLPATLATRNAQWLDDKGNIQSFRGADSRTQSDMWQQAVKTARTAADLFQSEDMKELINQLDRMSGGSWTRINPTQLQGTLRGMSAFATTLNMTSGEFANMAVNAQQGMINAVGSAFGSPTSLRTASGRAMGGMATPEYAMYMGQLMGGIVAAKGDMTENGFKDAIGMQMGLTEMREGSPAGKAIRVIELLKTAGQIKSDDPAYRAWRDAIANNVPLGEREAAAYKVLGNVFGDAATAKTYVNNNTFRASLTAQFADGTTERRISELGNQYLSQEMGQRMGTVANQIQNGLISDLTTASGLARPINDPAQAAARVKGIQDYLDQQSTLTADPQKIRQLHNAIGAIGTAFAGGEAEQAGLGWGRVTAVMGTDVFNKIGGKIEMAQAGENAYQANRLAALTALGPQAWRINSELRNLNGPMPSGDKIAMAAYDAANVALQTGNLAEAERQLKIAKQPLDADTRAMLETNALGDQATYMQRLELANARQATLSKNLAVGGVRGNALITAAWESAAGVLSASMGIEAWRAGQPVMDAYAKNAKELEPIIKQMNETFGIQYGGFGSFAGRLVNALVDPTKDAAYVFNMKVLAKEDEDKLRAEGANESAITKAARDQGKLTQRQNAILEKMKGKDLEELVGKGEKDVRAWVTDFYGEGAAPELIDSMVKGLTDKTVGVAALSKLEVTQELKKTAKLGIDKVQADKELDKAARSKRVADQKDADDTPGSKTSGTAAATGKEGTDKKEKSKEAENLNIVGTLVLRDGATRGIIATGDMMGRARKFFGKLMGGG